MVKRIFVACAVLCAVSSLAHADDIARLVDGSIIKGQIVERSAESIAVLVADGDGQRVVDISVADISLLMEDGRDPDVDVDAVRTNVDPDDAIEISGDCYVITLSGEFGKEIEAGPLRAALARAVRDGVTNIIFDLESYGGALSTATAITEILNEYGDRLHYSCVVRRGISASIWLIFACDEIFVTPDATIGGAVAYSIENTTGSAQVDAKFNSVIAAGLEATATRKGHTASLVRAMILPTAELWMHTDADGRTTLEQSRVEIAEGGTIVPLVHRGGVLTLTAREAIEVGLATPIHNVEPATVGFWIDGRAWKSAGDRARQAYDDALVECNRIRIVAVRKYGNLMDDLENARVHEPRNFVYMYNPNSRRMSRRSQIDWADRSKSAIKSYRRAKRYTRELLSIIDRAHALHIADPTRAGVTRASLEMFMQELDREIMRLRREVHAEFLPLDFEAYVPN